MYHYLDDFATLGPLTLNSVAGICRLYSLSAKIWHTIGSRKTSWPKHHNRIPWHHHRYHSSRTLPADDKLGQLQSLLKEWKNRKSCTRRELELLIGVLQHACTMVAPGRTFLRQVIALLSVAKQPHHHIHLNAAFRSDLTWWRIFAASWNGSALVIRADGKKAQVTTHPSGTWGCGG